MIDNNTICLVTNRSASKVIYKIAEGNIRREFAIGETKKIPYGELVQLSFQSGGREIMNEFLQIELAQARQDLGIHEEPEYNYSQQDIKNLMINGSLDEFLDCLDFAPTGVIDIIRRLAVELPLEDYNKRKALKDKLGFEVDVAIRHIEAEKEDEAPVEQKQRRVAPAATAPTRRAPAYKVVSKEE